MAVSEDDAAEILARCARHCCICRRFRPLHLQVHHIIEHSDGGSDEPDNLIAICVSCHSDAHTATKLTRRFTVRELKLHRDAVYALVREGKLPGPESTLDAAEVISAAIIAQLRTAVPAKLGNEELPVLALEILITAANERQKIDLSRSHAAISIIVGEHAWHRVYKTPVHYPDEIIKLLSAGLVDGGDDSLYVTPKGSQFVDDMVSSMPLFTLKKAKCMRCSLHFMLCTWEPSRHSAATLHCPECGQHQGGFLVWEQLERGFIFQFVPGSAQRAS